MHAQEEAGRQAGAVHRSSLLAAWFIVRLICNFLVPAGLLGEQLLLLALTLCINSHKWLRRHMSASARTTSRGTPILLNIEKAHILAVEISEKRGWHVNAKTEIKRKSQYLNNVNFYLRINQWLWTFSSTLVSSHINPLCFYHFIHLHVFNNNVLLKLTEVNLVVFYF